MAVKKVDELKVLQGVAEKARVSDAPVYSFMSKSLVSIPEGLKIYSAIQTLAAHRVGSAPVVNGQSKIVGIVSEHDLLIQTATRDVAQPIQYNKDPKVISPETPLKDVLVLLYKNRHRRIPVVMKDKSIVGIVTRMDVLLKLIGKAK
jgi:IMP dehydrogenase